MSVKDKVSDGIVFLRGGVYAFPFHYCEQQNMFYTLPEVAPPPAGFIEYLNKRSNASFAAFVETITSATYDATFTSGPRHAGFDISGAKPLYASAHE